MKKVLATILALVMALGLTTMAWADASAPTKNGNVWTVTPENAQDTLDGKYGSIDGTTIVLSAGTYERLELGRATKYEGSGTEYYGGLREDFEETTKYDNYQALLDAKTAGTLRTPHYIRNMSNVTITAENGAEVTVKGIKAVAGHMCSEASDITGLKHDYTLDCDVSANYTYYLAQKWSNVRFEGIVFTAKVNIASSQGETDINGMSFKNCTFNINNTANGNQAIRFYSEKPTGKVKNLVVDGCTFNSCYQGVYAQNVADVTVMGCTFNTAGYNAIAVQGDSSGTIVIKENYIDKASDRAIRFGKIGDASTITVNNNIMVNSGDDDGQLFKAVSLPAADKVNLENNYWNGKDAATAVAEENKSVRPTKTGITGGTFKREVTADMLAEGVVTVKNANGSYTVVEKTPEQPPRYYYNSTTTTDTKKDDTKGSPKTFDAGVGIYALTAVLSVTGMACVGKKKF